MMNRRVRVASQQQHLAEVRMCVRVGKPDSQRLLVIRSCIVQHALASKSESEAGVSDIVAGCYLNGVFKKCLAVFPVSNLKRREREASNARQSAQAGERGLGPWQAL